MAPWFTKLLSFETWEAFSILLPLLHLISNPSASPLTLLLNLSSTGSFLSFLQWLRPSLSDYHSSLLSKSTLFSFCSFPTLPHTEPEETLRNYIRQRPGTSYHNKSKTQWLSLAHKPGGSGSASLFPLMSSTSHPSLARFQPLWSPLLYSYPHSLFLH